MDKQKIGELLLILGTVLFVLGAVIIITRQSPADELTGIGALALIFMGVGASMKIRRNIMKSKENGFFSVLLLTTSDFDGFVKIVMGRIK